MAYTSHGHHIPGTIKGEGTPGERARCGGVGNCTRCTGEAKSAVINSRMVGEKGDYQGQFKNLVRDYVVGNWTFNRSHDPLPKFDVYVVWFSKTLQNAKAMLATTLPDNRYFEVTYNGDEEVTYFDVYEKLENVVIPDKR